MFSLKSNWTLSDVESPHHFLNLVKKDNFSPVEQNCYGLISSGFDPEMLHNHGNEKDLLKYNEWLLRYGNCQISLPYWEERGTALSWVKGHKCTLNQPVPVTVTDTELLQDVAHTHFKPLLGDSIHPLLLFYQNMSKICMTNLKLSRSTFWRVSVKKHPKD